MAAQIVKDVESAGGVVEGRSRTVRESHNLKNQGKIFENLNQGCIFVFILWPDTPV